ncbi:MAG: hypothetical protein JWR59_496, partial [Brevundimonas sp.]|nr:hypothetical protein [Brevundimonas sp.]
HNPIITDELYGIEIIAYSLGCTPIGRSRHLVPGSQRAASAGMTGPKLDQSTSSNDFHYP